MQNLPGVGLDAQAARLPYGGHESAQKASNGEQAWP